MTRHPSLLLLLLLCLTGLTSLSLSRADTAAAPAAKPVRILNAHLGELPGLINADKTGPFVDLVRAIDDLYPEVSIRITIYPLARAMAGVIAGTADFSLPAIRNLQDADLLPYRFSTRSFGKVTHVLYSNTDHLITPDMAYGIVPTKRDLLIEATPGFLPIPLQRSMSIEQSLRKLARGRIDAFIWAQEEADLMLRQLKLTNIHREHLGDFEDVFIIAKGPAGDEVDRFLGEAIDRLVASGKLAEIYSRLHRPYVEWQPPPEPLPAKDVTKAP
ncbi:transporter substrate-binding domain-containing protein [Aeromonas hydrophila]|uniref:transporter substrate-binding domain-containing protein n=1 Tax=Aeromonas hydrophila TaxID=644 RepID=UPI0004D51BCC|nr:transporter substrate-binding domain-containing protein [Aeromonas hydrophila]EJN6954945.1 transporter substrate-binding domain-containing protein [Aeromonas hydrophila]KER64544.1 ABC transporter substrate-binding protein [Aeromonas hydrophila]MCX4040449.1 transporter substrate-binding domain-containing protein [Aeromonas hydrophila]OCA62274.1 ABC transporter substrate-binding protein [Aeromonas hydrophila]OCY09241.1 ABC transporter substrate-binding protein [Aeromonas hydrophila]